MKNLSFHIQHIILENKLSYNGIIQLQSLIKIFIKEMKTLRCF